MSSLLLAVHVHRHLHGPSIDYAGLGLAATVGWIGVPGVGEAALIAAGVVAARGRLDVSQVVGIAFVGATVGGVLGWAVGLRIGHSVFAGPGPFRATRLKVLSTGERFYARYGGLAVFFTPSWLAGINRMRTRSYLVLNAISALLWALIVGVGAYLVGPSIEDIVSDVGLGGLVLLALVVGAGSLAERVRRRRGRDGSPRG
jgi:membrane protein DedA with SNARE-associated domain